MENIILKAIGKKTLKAIEIVDAIKQYHKVQYVADYTRKMKQMADSGKLIRSWDDYGECYYSKAQA